MGHEDDASRRPRKASRTSTSRWNARPDTPPDQADATERALQFSPHWRVRLVEGLESLVSVNWEPMRGTAHRDHERESQLPDAAGTKQASTRLSRPKGTESHEHIGSSRLPPLHTNGGYL